MEHKVQLKSKENEPSHTTSDASQSIHAFRRVFSCEPIDNGVCVFAISNESL